MFDAWNEMAVLVASVVKIPIIIEFLKPLTNENKLKMLAYFWDTLYIQKNTGIINGKSSHHL